ncbi:MAG: hypothetical protein Cons2KO_16350 [Congregibacter sp.]
MTIFLQHLKDRLRSRPLLLFTLKVFALLPACFVLWHYLSAFVAGPGVAVAKAILTAWLPELVDEVSLRSTEMFVMSRYGESGGQIVSADQAGNQLAYPISTRALSYSTAFYAALHFATGPGARWSQFGWSLLVLWMLLAIGLVSTAAKDLMLAMPEVFTALPQTPPADVIALLYQFSALIVPPLAPILLWAYNARDSEALRSLLPRPRKPAQASE